MRAVQLHHTLTRVHGGFVRRSCRLLHRRLPSSWARSVTTLPRCLSRCRHWSSRCWAETRSTPAPRQQAPQLCAELPTFEALCTAIADYGDGDGGEQETHGLLQGLLLSYKKAFGVQWPQLFERVPGNLRSYLQSKYQI